MNTGNIADLRVAGELVIDVTEIAPCEELGDVRFVASYRGWYRYHNVGTGTTCEQAIADLKKKCE